MPSVHQASLKIVEKLMPLDIRIPKWDPNRLEPRDCPFCSTASNTTEYQRPDGLVVKRCKSCKTLFVSPAPNANALDEFYSSYHAQYFKVSSETSEEALSNLNAADPFDDVRIQVISSLLDIKKSRVLDVGCGKAQFLFLLKRLGADVVGIEINEDAVSFSKQLGIKSIHSGTIESFKGEKQFDLITLNDIIEHPLNPLELLRKTIKLLNTDGLLLIWTPNGDRPDGDSEKVTLRVDLEHLQYLGAKTLKYLTQSLPLEIIHYETLGYPSFEAVTNKTPMITKRFKVFAKSFAKKTPGFMLANRIRQKLLASDTVRLGNYHLFCVLRKID